jgi:DNA-binding NarL/FixJ family response regulator
MPDMAADLIPVMVVDDDAAFRAAATQLLEVSDGFAVRGEAESGEAALLLLAGHGPVLVLMDINMPGLGGVAATVIIRRQHPDVPVVLMSTYDVADLPPNAATCGAQAYVRKEHLAPDVLRQAWFTHPIPG